MRRFLFLGTLLGTAALLCAAAQLQRPLERTFEQGDTQRYRVELIARSEVQGQRAEKIGARAYAAPFHVFSQEKLSWSVSRRVVSVASDGSAEIEETLDQFSPLAELPEAAGMAKPEERASAPQTPDAATEKAKTDAALRLALLEWTRPGKRILRYRETPRGDLIGLSAEGGPALDDAPAVITLWLRRAVRPRAVLRSAPGAADGRWREPRIVEMPPWKNAGGTETGEWQAGPLPQLSAVRFDNLHVMQQITAKVPALEGVLREGEARFHAESLSTVVGAGALLYGGYGALAQATRSASREVNRTLDPVPGLAEPPRFRSVLSVEIRITHAEFPPR